MRNRSSGMFCESRLSKMMKRQDGLCSCTAKKIPWKAVFLSLAICVTVIGGTVPRKMVYASDTTKQSIFVTPAATVTPTPTAAPVPTEGVETVFKDGVSDDYLGDVATGLTTTVDNLMDADEDTIDQIISGSTAIFNEVLYYLPYVGIGFFVLGAFIAMFSIKNKSNRRWGIRMAVVTSIVMFLGYIFIIVMYDYNFRGLRAEEIIRPEYLDYYGELYFDVYEEVLSVERAAGIADKVLSRNLFGILIYFYAESASYVGIAVFGLGLLLFLISKKNGIVRKWAGVCLCFVVPLILYIGYWYITRVISVAG